MEDFITTAQNYGINSQKIRVYLACNGNIDDSGPNNNDPTHDSTVGLNFLQEGYLKFSEEILKINGSDDGSDMSFFIDFTKSDSSLVETILSNGNFKFGCACSGRFFVSFSGKTLFFKKTITPKRAILVLSKYGSFFELGFFEPASETISYEQVTFSPSEVSLEEDYKIGDGSSNFEIRAASLIFENLLGMIKRDLCASLNFQKPYTVNSMNSFVSVSNGSEDEFQIKITNESNKKNVAIKCIKSKIANRFISGTTHQNDVSFYINGEEVTPSFIGSNYWEYNHNEEVTSAIIDNFSDDNYLEWQDTFSNNYISLPEYFPINSAIILLDSLRIEDYIEMSENNMCHGLNIVHEQNNLENL